jgi:GNAT superfamily N-acetyltransferase
MQSGPADRPDILNLISEARGDDLTDEERAQQGFIQGHFDESLLERFQNDIGVFIARDDTNVAGFAMASRPGIVSGGPPAKTIDAVQKALPDVSEEELFLYGPAAVARQYQGQDILTKLLTHICSVLREQFSVGAAFVEEANQRSLAIHRHYPMSETTSFTFKDRPYAVFTFSPEEVLEHYENND